MGIEIRLKSSSKSRKEILSGDIITKHYDGGDASLLKKYSRLNVTYKIDGSGASPLVVSYKIDDESQWKNFNDDPDNPYSSLRATPSLGKVPRFMRTNGLYKNAEWVFPRNSKGKTVSIKFYLDLEGANGAGFENFKLSDVTFTFRPVMRK